MASNELIIKIGASSKAFEDELDKAKAKIENFEKAASTAAKISGVAFAGFSAVIAGSVAAYSEAEQAANQLNQSLQAQGILSEELVNRYAQQADNLQMLTGVSGDAITKNQALLQGFLGQTEITEELTKAVLDLSAAQGIELDAAFKIVGKSIASDTNMLARYGIEIDASASKQEKMAAVIDGVNKKFEGQAEAAAKGLGQLKILKETVGDIFEELGKNFAPAISNATSLLVQLAKAVRDSEGLTRFTAALIAGGAAISGIVFALSTLGVAIATITPLVTALGISFNTLLGPIGLVAAAIGLVTAAFVSFGKETKGSAKSSKEIKEELAQLVAELEDIDKVARLSKSTLGEVGNAYKKQNLLKEIQELKTELAKVEEQESKSAKNRDSRAAAEAKQSSDKRAALKAEQEALIAETGGASTAVVALKKQEADLLKQIEDTKNKAIRENLEKNLQAIRSLLADALQVEASQRDTFAKQILANNAEFNKLDSNQKTLFLERNQNELAASLQTQSTLQAQAAKESIQNQIAVQNELLANQEKFGKTLGSIVSVINFQAVLDFASMGLGAIEALIGTAKDNSAEKAAQAEEEKAFIEQKRAAVQSEYETQLALFEKKKEAGEIDKATFEAQKAEAEALKNNRIQAIDSEAESLKAIQKQKESDQKKEAAQQKAATGLISGTLGAVADSYLPGIGGVVSQMVSLAAAGPEAIQGAIDGIIQQIPIILQTIAMSMDEILLGAADILITLVLAAIDQIGPFIGNILGSLGDLISKLLDGLLKAVFNLANNLDSILMSILDGLLKAVFTLIDRLPIIVNKLAELMPIIAMKLSNLMPEVSIKFTQELIKMAPSLLKTIGKEAMSQMINSNIAGFENVINGFVDILNKVPGVDIKRVSLPRVQLETGGMIKGGLAGIDSVPALLSPGELVIPAEFSRPMLELLRRNMREERNGGINRQGSMTQKVLIGFDGTQASQVLTARQIEDRALGISREALA